MISNIGPGSPDVAAPELSRNFLSIAFRISNSESKLSLASLSKPHKAFPACPPLDPAALSAMNQTARK